MDMPEFSTEEKQDLALALDLLCHHKRSHGHKDLVVLIRDIDVMATALGVREELNALLKSREKFQEELGARAELQRPLCEGP